MYYKIRDRGQKEWQAVLRAYKRPETMSGTLHARPMWLYGKVCWAFMGAPPLGNAAVIHTSIAPANYYGQDFIKVALREL